MKRFAELLDERKPMFTLCANVLDDLPDWLAAARARRRLGLTECAEEIGISAPAVARVEQHMGTCQTVTAIRILRWLGEQ